MPHGTHGGHRKATSDFISFPRSAWEEGLSAIVLIASEPQGASRGFQAEFDPLTQQPDSTGMAESRNKFQSERLLRFVGGQ